MEAKGEYTEVACKTDKQASERERGERERERERKERKERERERRRSTYTRLPVCKNPTDFVKKDDGCGRLNEPDSTPEIRNEPEVIENEEEAEMKTKTLKR
jgi:hypothetical protein